MFLNFNFPCIPGEFSKCLRFSCAVPPSAAFAAPNALIKDPALLELLDAMSIVGLLDQLQGPGLVLNEIEADFINLPEQIKFEKASAFGPSIGISLEGYYDKSNNNLNMQGVLSPLYVVNAIGSIFTRKGEGLLGFNYRLKGNAEKPQVLVNPLSIFTPAIFREIFRRPVPNLE